MQRLALVLLFPYSACLFVGCTDDRTIGAVDGGPTAPPGQLSEAGTKLDAPGGAEAGPGGATTGALSCSGYTMPSFSKRCGAPSDCAVVMHRYDCCGSNEAIGIAKDQVSGFEAEQTKCAATYPGCGCAPLPTKTEDGAPPKFGTKIGVDCVKGACRTFAETTSHNADAGPQTDAGGACWAAWQAREAVVKATQRPATKAMKARFSYEVDAPNGQPRAQISLDNLVGHNVVAKDDGPVSVATHVGKWAELRDANDNTLHTVREYYIVSDEAESFGPGGPSMHYTCPTSGVFSVDNLSNDPAGTQIVVFSVPIDGKPNDKTIELARFQLP